MGRQAYYASLAPWMLHQPLAVALVHMGCLCLTGALLYRAFRPALGRGAAFAVSTGPWMMESSRLLVAWPATFQDTSALLFVALALHEAVARRRWSFLGAGLAALLCKEVAAIALITMMACPAVRFSTEKERRIWIISTGALLAAWAVTYAWVVTRASLAFPVSGTTLSASDWVRAISLVPWWSFKAIWSLPASSGPLDVLFVVGFVALISWSRVGEALRSHEPQLRAWWTWGLLWSVPLILTLVPFYPGWGPHRFPFAGFGILIATIVTLRALHRYALPLFLALRLGLFLMAPKPVHEIALDPPNQGASIDVPRLSRLQRLVSEVRHKIQSRYPKLPHGAGVVWENFPAMTEYAFGSRLALCTWYRDTTLKWVPINWWIAHPSIPAATIVEFQGDPNHEIALVEPDAMRAVLQANTVLISGHEAESLRWLSRAESLQVDTSAVVFHRSIVAKRAYSLASLRFQEGRYEEARSHLLELLAAHPGDVPSRRLLEAVEESLARIRR
jgi:hypothetical protein